MIAELVSGTEDGDAEAALVAAAAEGGCGASGALEFACDGGDPGFGASAAVVAGSFGWDGT